MKIYHIPPDAFTTHPLKDALVKIRTQVFIEEQNVPVSEEYDGFDNDSEHFVLVNEDDQAIGCARLRMLPNCAKIERMAVCASERSKGLGSHLLKHLLDRLKDHPKPIVLNAQVQVTRFYEKFGFFTEGAPFEDAGIMHYKMRLHRD